MKQCVNQLCVFLILIGEITTTLRGTTTPTSPGTDLVSDSVSVSVTLPTPETVTNHATCHCLTDHIVCYENVSLYVRHSTGEGHEICFTAFHRRFNLLLQRIEPATLPLATVFSHKLNITTIGFSTQSRHSVDITQYYTGHLLDEHSRFFGHFQNGVLYGEIYTAIETYYVEPSERYFRSTDANQLNLVIYRQRDVVMQTAYSFSTRRSIVHDQQNKNLSTFYHKERKVHFQRHRQKRGSTHTSHIACGLKIIVDYNFYKFYCDGSVMKTVDEIVYTVATANTIFRTVDFDSDGEPDNVGFTVKEIVLHVSNTSKYYLSESRDSLTVLNTFSRYNLSGYCLGVLFTYNDFDDGVVGLSWRASSSLHGRPGGICNAEIRSSGSVKSVNSLLVTAYSYGAPLTRWHFALTLTHELGHSFGSQHDDKNNAECFPDGYKGKYIMNGILSYNSKLNNRKFSKCSLLQMSPVLFYKSNCFEIVNVVSLCGNYMIDPGEGCDCGPLPDQCHSVDPCCVQPSKGGSGCRVATELGKHCSARVSACCSQDCRVETRSTLCRSATECTEAVFCNGVDVDCPKTIPRPDGTLCMGGMRVCMQGDCILSRCRHRGWEDCQCLEKTPEFCQLCCRNVSVQDSACVPAYKLSHTDELVESVYEPFGEMCGNGAGYCNNEHVCVTGYSRACRDTVEHVFRFTSNEMFIDWLLNQWFLLLFGVSTASLFLTLLHTYTENLDTVSLMAFTCGKSIALCEHVTLDDQLQHLESSYQRKLANLTKGCPINMVVGIARLCHLFPTVPKTVITQVINNSISEELAVRWLLLKGYPMKKLPVHEC